MPLWCWGGHRGGCQRGNNLELVIAYPVDDSAIRGCGNDTPLDDLGDPASKFAELGQPAAPRELPGTPGPARSTSARAGPPASVFDAEFAGDLNRRPCEPVGRANDVPQHPIVVSHRDGLLPNQWVPELRRDHLGEIDNSARQVRGDRRLGADCLRLNVVDIEIQVYGRMAKDERVHSPKHRGLHGRRRVRAARDEPARRDHGFGEGAIEHQSARRCIHRHRQSRHRQWELKFPGFLGEECVPPHAPGTSSGPKGPKRR